MRMIVTGSTGFIGKRLVERLLEEGHEVACTVRAASDTAFLEKAGVTLVNCDITDAGAVLEAFARNRPEAVFHCAASVMEKDESRLFRTNVTGTRNICEACLRGDVERLIYLSSVAVVSGNREAPLTDDMPCRANNAYGQSKLEAERIVAEYREKGLKAVMIRPCMIYGEEEPHALGRILKLASSRRIPVLDVPAMDSKLQLGYVGNVVQALILALKNDAALQGTFIVADEEAITLRKFVELIYDELGKGYPPVIPAWVVRILAAVPYLRKKIESIGKDRAYDISRSREILGYAPSVPTEEALRRTVRHWKERKGSGS